MKIVDVCATELRFSRTPSTLKKHLCTPTSRFEDAPPDGWFGPVALTLVEVRTDDGITGVGTIGGFTSGGTRVVEDYLKPVVVGASPFDTELLWDKMYRVTARFGRKGAAVAALSAIDIACWDIKGKALNQPVYNLLGGKTKESVPAYASRLYALDDLDALAAEAVQYVQQGFRVLKQRFGFGPSDGREGMKRNEALIAAVREAVGEDIDLAADAYMGWDYAYACEMERRLRRYRLAWLEEPFMPDEVDTYVRFRQSSQTPVSAGEHEYTRYGFQQLISKGALDILQPDANRVGGITEMKKVCALAEAAGLPVYPHSNEAHNLHVIFSQSNCPLVEYFPDVEPDTGNELFWKVFRGEVRAAGGALAAPVGPGLGIEIDRAAVERLRR